MRCRQMPPKVKCKRIYSGTYSVNGTEESEGGRNDVGDVDPVVALMGNGCLDGCSLVEWDLAESRGVETCEGSRLAGEEGIGGVFRSCCCRRELAVMSTSTSLDKGPAMPTACATAV